MYLQLEIFNSWNYLKLQPRDRIKRFRIVNYESFFVSSEWTTKMTDFTSPKLPTCFSNISFLKSMKLSKQKTASNYMGKSLIESRNRKKFQHKQFVTRQNFRSRGGLWCIRQTFEKPSVYRESFKIS